MLENITFVDPSTCPCLMTLTQGIFLATWYFFQKAEFPPPDMTELMAIAECTSHSVALQQCDGAHHYSLLTDSATRIWAPERSDVCSPDWRAPAHLYGLCAPGLEREPDSLSLLLSQLWLSFSLLLGNSLKPSSVSFYWHAARCILYPAELNWWLQKRLFGP